MKLVAAIATALGHDQAELEAIVLAERYPEAFDVEDVEELAGIIRRRHEARRELGKEAAE